MLEQFLNAVTQNPWVLALGTVAFFTIKGILWLVVPFLIIRWRRLSFRRNVENEITTADVPTTHSVAVYVPQSKRAG